MPEPIARFDAADYLATNQDIDAYLEAAAADPEDRIAALATIARARNLSQLSRDARLTREGLYKALAPAGNPSFATVAKIAAALGFQLSLKRAGEPAA
jgi:probable addiction module antidote protein